MEIPIISISNEPIIQENVLVIKEKEKPAKWTNTLKKYFIDTILDEMDNGSGWLTEDNRIRSTSWTNVTKNFQQISKQPYTSQQLQSQYCSLKKKYSIFLAIKENSEFSWDSNDCMVTASHKVWDAYIDKHPEAKEFRSEPLFCFNELDRIFGGKIPNDRHSIGSSSSSTTSLEIPSSPNSSMDNFVTTSSNQNMLYSSSDINADSNANTPVVSNTGRKRKSYSQDVIIDLLSGIAEAQKKACYSISTDAIQQFTNMGIDGLTPKQSLKVKKVFANQPAFAEMFIGLSEDEKKCFVDDVLNDTL
jgi:hypothetical protein